MTSRFIQRVASVAMLVLAASLVARAAHVDGPDGPAGDSGVAGAVPTGVHDVARSTQDATPAQAETLDVLFVGNSYTYFNNLPALVEGIAEGLDGPTIRAEMHTGPGFRLAQHLEQGLGDVLDGSADTGEPWDRVVLQEQSQLATDYADAATGKLGAPTAFHSSVRSLVASIEEHDAEPLLYMTWAKRKFPDQTADLARAYDDIGRELEVPVAPVGLAWARVTNERPNASLYLADGSHPNPAGSYLTACVFYAALTGRTPEGAPAELNGTPWSVAGPVASEDPTVLVSLDPDLAVYLQRVAWEVVASRDGR